MTPGERAELARELAQLIVNPTLVEELPLRRGAECVTPLYVEDGMGVGLRARWTVDAHGALSVELLVYGGQPVGRARWSQPRGAWWRGTAPP